MHSRRDVERETSRIARRFWWARHWPRVVTVAFATVVVALSAMLAGCTTPGQYAASVYCGMTDEERALARERLEAYCDED